MSESLQPHGLQHARLACPSLSPGVCSNSCPWSQWSYLTISSSTTLFSFCLLSFQASGSFPMSQLFASGGLSIGSSPFNEYSGLISFRIDWLTWFPCSSRDSQESSPAPQFESIGSLTFSLLYGPTLTSVHIYQKDHNFDDTDYFNFF